MTTPTPGNRRTWRRLHPNVWVATAASFLTDVSTEMIVNLLPLFLANVLGVRTSVIGLIEGSAEATASLLKLGSGWFSDRIGNRKWLMVTGYGLSAAVKPLLFLATTWTQVLGVRFADRVGKGIRNAPRDALIADSVTADQRGLAFGLHRAGDTLGAALGIAIALAVVWRAQGNALALGRPAFQTVVLLSVLPAAAAVLLLAVAIRDTGQARTGTQPLPRLVGVDRRFRRFLLVVALFTLGNSADAFIILRAQERGLTVPGVLAMLLTFNLVYSAVSGPAGALSDRIGRRRLIVGGWLAYAVIYLLLALAQTAWHVWVLFAAYGIYYGAAEGSARALVADLVVPEQRGTAYGLYNAAVGIALLPASVLAGVVWQGVGAWSGFGAAAPFVVGAGLALAAALLLALWVEPGEGATSAESGPGARTG